MRRPAAIVAAVPFSPPAPAETRRPAPVSTSQRVIHFGQFIRHHRIRAGKTTESFGKEIGLTGRRVIGIEAMAAPDVQQTTLTALARALHLDPDELDATWRSTPVPLTPRRAGPTTESAQRFAAACRRAGISPAEGMRRLRQWLIGQDQGTQQRVLQSVAPAAPAPMFTDLVDHLQDPAQATQQRVASRAARAGRMASRAQPAASRSKK